MRDKFLIFGAPTFGEEEIAEVVKTLKSGWWGTGPQTELFQKEFSKYIGSKYALGVNSATAGLHIALQVLGIGSGDEVITTPLTFCSTVNTIVHSGAKPVFADVEADTWNISAVQIEKKITKRTKAIIPVHLHGRPCDMDTIMHIAKKYNLFVIEDAAHAIEAKYKNKKIGTIADITVFSFYVTKNLATGEGGMITANKKKWIEQAKILSLHGLSRDAYKRYSVKKFSLYECLIPGYKYNLTDIMSSLGIHQLKKITKHTKLRKKYWDIYMKELQKIDGIILPAVEEKNTYHARHLFAILLPLEQMTIKRNTFVDQLIKHNIGSGVHFAPIHLHPYYRKTFNYKNGDFPNAEYVGERTVSLPLAPNLSESDIKEVIATVAELMKKYRKKKK